VALGFAAIQEVEGDFHAQARGEQGEKKGAEKSGVHVVSGARKRGGD